MQHAVLIGKLRRLVQSSMAKHAYESAVFFADKLVTLTHEEPEEIFRLAQAFYLSQQYRRALWLLRNTDMVKMDLRFRYLAARCLAEVGDWEECLGTLGGWEEDTSAAVADLMQGSQAERMTRGQLGPESESLPSEEASYKAALCMLRGRVYAAMENQARACLWYQAALQLDPFCYEAFQVLIEKSMLTGQEERVLLEKLPFGSDDEWIQLLYRAKCKKYEQASTFKQTLRALQRPIPPDPAPVSTPDSTAMPPSSTASRCMAKPVEAHLDADAEMEGEESELVSTSGCGLAGNLDVLTCRADWLYHSGAHQECYQLTTDILDRDMYAVECLPTHLAAALELCKKNDLFLQAHRLVQEYPSRALSWYAVGVYYLATHQHEQARRYFGKATALDASCAVAWIGFGHAFALQDESDQAMAAYRTAARLFRGLHMPLVGMGMEYQRMNNLPLAQQLFNQARSVCPADPLVANELGVLAFRNRQLDAAIHHFTSALELLPPKASAASEATLVNLGHVYRRQKRWPEAIAAFRKALGLAPGHASTYASLAFTHHLQGDLQVAIENYHKALGMRPDDSFTAEMLTCAMDDEVTRDEAGAAY
ncbi:hypothetical protein WJX84_003493 [Apatococcus fuscideae]|uniref:Anaphase-promoting complex subunit 6 n=1 Tax=Apatococcus fuscideae TaxID=2026836 RepID=A0AAW1SMV1_9CHLO